MAEGRPVCALPAAVFDVRQAPFGPVQEYREALAALDPMERRFMRPGSLAAHRLSLAVGFGVKEDVIRDCREDPSSRFEVFDQVLHVAGALIDQGNPRGTWEIVTANLRIWRPVDRAQVAPVELNTDPILRALASPERWIQVLEALRGMP